MKELNEGDKAPDFKGKNQEGKTISLDDFKGKKLILYFYPKDNTPGCTAEACDLNDNYDYWISKGYEVVGVSPDSEESHRKFIDKYGLKFNLISDPEKDLLQAYGAWGEKKLYGKTYMGVLRTTFVINEEGIIEKIFRKVKTKEHTTQIAGELNL
ncbi:thioredoxin-dependent thiol peroxidase [Prolixibacter sp. SD074]|uniref:thioredoxin-dependent thiol peroxidase n=1 Tax=Prolixibacter sp. SD074 TaxID=2652391 RepID=UPI001298F9C8|nr:thioredoxin-dependent thiol peroxidase [Prolixibacter sp. SD074]